MVVRKPRTFSEVPNPRYRPKQMSRTHYLWFDRLVQRCVVVRLHLPRRYRPLRTRTRSSRFRNTHSTPFRSVRNLSTLTHHIDDVSHMSPYHTLRRTPTCCTIPYRKEPEIVETDSRSRSHPRTATGTHEVAHDMRIFLTVLRL